MKKILLAILLTLSFTASAGTVLKYETKCIAGYAFAIVVVRQSGNKPVGVSITQIFEKLNAHISIPMRCK